MAEQWDTRMMEFIRRTGEEIKTETQRLVSEVKDPEKQQKVREALKELGTWAKRTAEEAAEKVRTGEVSNWAKRTAGEAAEKVRAADVGTWAKRTAEEAAEKVRAADVGTWAKRTAEEAAEKVRAADVGTWAKRTAGEAAGVVETAVRRAEGAFRRPVDSGSSDGRRTSAEEVTQRERVAPRSTVRVKGTGKKTVGKAASKGARSGSGSSTKKIKATKTIGKEKA
ncbi:MAG: hypothetical protein ACT4TC_08705 [Myxococcaceae bacterium]